MRQLNWARGITKQIWVSQRIKTVDLASYPFKVVSQ
jgi:hypothetical protein